MQMIDVVIAILLIFFALTVIGIGPSLLLMSFEKRLQNSLLIAPAVGLILNAILGTYLVLMDFPVALWAKPLLTVEVLASTIMVLMTVWKKQNSGFFTLDKDMMGYYLLGLLLVTLLLVVPMVVGGLNFTVLRGNAYDSFSYITLAGYLLHAPYSWWQHTSMQALINAHPSYLLATKLLPTRWSTSMLLAWSSQIVDVPLYRIEYGFTILFFMITYGCSYAFSTLLNIPKRYILILSVAVCIGFWAQVLLDMMRAMSEISVLPVLVFIGVLIASVDDKLSRISWAENVLLGFAMAATFFLYAEIIPTLILGLLIFVTVRFIQKKYSLRQIGKRYYLPIITFIVAVIPAQYLLRFFWNQILTATLVKSDWWGAYFGWFYSCPITGFFGLPPINILEILFFILAAILLLALLYIVVHMLSTKKNSALEKPTALIMSISLLFAAVLQFIFLVCNGQLWAAAKAISYGYPFIFFTTAAAGWVLNLKAPSAIQAWFLKMVKICIILWLLVQCTFGIFRSFFVPTFRQNMLFMSSTSNQKHHDWDILPFKKRLGNQKTEYLGLDIRDTWLVEYLGFVFGWDLHVIDLHGIREREGNKAVAWQSLPKQFTYLLISKDEPLIKKYKSKVIASNSELVLVEPTAQLTQEIIKKNNYHH